MVAAIVAVPLASFAVSVIDGTAAGLGAVAAAVGLAILALILFVIFLPAGVSVLAADPAHPVDLAVFLVALAGAHAVNWLIRPLADSNLWLLVYPAASALATLVIRSLARQRVDTRWADQA